MFTLILAVGSRGELGYKGGLPWGHLACDMKMFRDVTRSHTVVMGRKTWESVGKLPGRKNVVLTRSKEVSSLQSDKKGNLPDQVLNDLSILLPLKEEESVFVIGGREVYLKAVDLLVTKRFFITLVRRQDDTPFPCDVELPEALEWIQGVEPKEVQQEGDITVSFYQLDPIFDGSSLCQTERRKGEDNQVTSLPFTSPETIVQAESLHIMKAETVLALLTEAREERSPETQQ